MKFLTFLVVITYSFELAALTKWRVHFLTGLIIALSQHKLETDWKMFIKSRAGFLIFAVTSFQPSRA